MHSSDIAGLWSLRIPPYVRRMARHLYNLPLLADPRKRNSGLRAFLDGYAASMDIDPEPLDGRHLNKSADLLWEDFVKVASDANSAFRKIISINER